MIWYHSPLRYVCLATFGMAALAAQPVRAEVRAVLVGVGDYLYLDADLRGPPQDVDLMAQTLMARGVAAGQITALTTGQVPEGVATGLPQKAGIMAALADVAAQSAPGDTVVFYFSGHGSQAPDTSGDEGGGYDEILLPADATGWKGAIGAVENALVDDELAAWAQPLLARGVKVVGIVDACHSATGFRALGDGGGVARYIPPEMLGLPEDTPQGQGGADGLEGEFVFLYSSQSDQRSFEYPLGGDQALWHGEFTLRLTQVLRDAPAASWAQVLAAATEAMAQGPARQQPEGEGPLLDAPVFGQGAGGLRFAIRDGKLAAGLLEGLEAEAELALYADAAGGEALGQARVTQVEARSATLSDAIAGAAWAEVTAPAPPPDLRLGSPVLADGGEYGAWLAALPESGGAGPYDLVPVLVGGELALAVGDGVLDPYGPGSSARVRQAAGESEAEAVTRVLETAGHSLRLRQALAAAAGSGRGLMQRPVLEVSVERKPAQRDGQGCGKAGAGVAFEEGGTVAPCDQLWLSVRNASSKDQDVTVLYLAQDFQIVPIWPQSRLSNRLVQGEGFRTGLQIDPDTPPGVEEVWIIAVPADPEGPRADLTMLANPGQSRAGAASDAVLWLDRQLDGDAALRGFSAKPAPFALLRETVRIVPAD